MADTTTTVSRLELEHPDLGHSGGSGLHTKIAAMYSRIGDMMDSRFFTKDGLANGASQDFKHNFQVSFDDLEVVIYKRNPSTGGLTILSEDSTPKLSDFAVAAKSGDETTHIEVMNNSGDSQDIAVVVRQGAKSRFGTALRWNPISGQAPIEAEEFDTSVYRFETGKAQKLAMFFKVPKNYVPGKQIKMFLAHYSPSASGTILLQSLTSLVKKDSDSVGATTNQRNSINLALTNTVANQYREAVLDLTDTSGKVNSVSVVSGDILRVELSRGTDTDTDDIRLIPEGTEISF